MSVPKRLRVVAGGVVIADTVRGIILNESDHIPVYYFPIEDIRSDMMRVSGRTTTDMFKGTATYYSMLDHDGKTIEDLMWRYDGQINGCPSLLSYASFDWKKADRWYEEDEEIFVHPRDPFRRVDVLPSSRHVQVFLGGKLVADSRRANMLFETGLPTRYYFTITDLIPGIIAPSETVTRCPYKGIARYYNVTIDNKYYPDMVWYYPDPVHESSRIKGMVSFANEFVDRILVDGREQMRPVTSFSLGSDRGDPHPLSATVTV
ncbi:DUF427 domain-containing protein [Mesorhizobium hawassense]|nr:DUF427 domain-containing protein [Mesorhizobium hawassense]